MKKMAPKRKDEATRKGSPTPARRPEDKTGPGQPTPPDEHEGATEQEIGDRVGPGAGYDQEPEKEKDEGGVA
jgi:hypothetical protein